MGVKSRLSACALGPSATKGSGRCMKIATHRACRALKRTHPLKEQNLKVWFHALKCSRSWVVARSRKCVFNGDYLELDHKGWAPKNWCFQTVVLEKTLESPLDCKEIQPVHPKGDQSWVFIGRTHAEAEPLIFWPPDAKNRLTGKDPDSGKDWRE